MAFREKAPLFANLSTKSYAWLQKEAWELGDYDHVEDLTHALEAMGIKLGFHRPSPQNSCPIWIYREFSNPNIKNAMLLENNPRSRFQSYMLYFSSEFSKAPYDLGSVSLLISSLFLAGHANLVQLIHPLKKSRAFPLIESKPRSLPSPQKSILDKDRLLQTIFSTTFTPEEWWELDSAEQDKETLSYLTTRGSRPNHP